MRAIVTGSDGFVGSYLVQELLRQGYEVIAIDIGDHPHRLDESAEGLTYVSMSVEQIDELHLDKPSDVFYHFAWRGSAGEERTDEVVQTQNALSAVRCLKAAAKLGCKRFVFAGTIMEFETLDVTYEQGSRPSAPYIYGAAKAYAHLLCKPIANQLGIDLLWAYITNAYGPGETSKRFINYVVDNVIENKPLQFTSGVQNYDFVFVEDVARAFRLIGERGLANKGYMIGSGAAKPLRDFVLEAIKTIAPEREPVFGDVPYSGVMTSLDTFSIEALSRDCGFEPKVSFVEGIRRTFEWRKKNIYGAI